MSPHSPPVSSVYSLQTAYKLMIITNLSLGSNLRCTNRGSTGELCVDPKRVIVFGGDDVFKKPLKSNSVYQPIAMQ